MSIVSGSRIRRAVLASLAVSTACLLDGDLDRDRLSRDWPDWQRIETTELPEAWRLEQASVAFDAWEATVAITEISTDADATTIGFGDADGNSVQVRIARLPARPERDLAEGDRVRMQLIHRQGFEGVARGLAVRGHDGRVLLLFDDGGYGPAFYEDGVRGGVSVTRSLRGPNTGNSWESPDVTFQMVNQSLTIEEGETARLGDSGLAASVVVSREWTGAPPTDVDIAPLAYLIYRVR